MEWSSAFGKKMVVVLGVFLAIGLCCFTAVPAYSQVTGATLAGTVTDASGAVIAGATISVKNTATGVSRDTTSDSSGLYSMPNITPGDYEVRVTAKGFSTALQSNLNLNVGAQQQLNFSLKVGETSTTVQVTEAAPQVELTSSAVSGQVESEVVRELPLNGRDWTQLATLQPGVKRIETQMSTDTSARGHRGFGSELTVSGQRTTFNNYRIDGIGVTDYAMAAPGNVIGVVLGVDAIQEFTVLTGGFPAEYGRATGGVVNAISKSGTNQFHGTAYEFLRNSALDSRDYFTRASGGKIPDFKRNQFGVSAGGPIIKDKTFIFGDYEGLRQIKGIVSNVGVPSPALRSGTFTFSGATPANPNCIQIGTTQTCQVAINAYAQSLLQFWPAQTLAGNANVGRFVFAGRQVVPENYYTVRLDHRLGTNDNLFGTYLYDDTDYVKPDALNTVNTQSHTTRQTIALEWSHTFSSSFVNAARIGYNRDNVKNQFTPTAILAAANSTALGAIPGQNAPRLSVHSGVGDFFGGVNAGSHYLHTWNSDQAYDDAFWVHGSHTIKFGGGVERVQYNQHTFQEPGGRYQFTDFSFFLSGNPKSFEGSLVNLVDNPREFRQTVFGAYVQDDWKIKSNLTLNVGLRYEMATVLNDAQGRITNLANIGDANPVCGTQFTAPIPAQPGASCASVGPYYKNPTLKNFEPRLGFAWDPFKDGKTSVRGGFGIYDVLPLPGYFLLQQNQAAPFLIFKSTKTFAANGSSFAPGFGGGQLNSAGGSKLAASTIETNPKRNYVMQWNLNVQRQLTSDITVTAGYIGSHGVHLLMRGDDGNMTTPVPASTGGGYFFNAPKTNSNLGIIRYIYWNTDSHYDALNLTLDKKFSHGFQYQVAYTFAKSLDDASQTIAGDTFSNDINSPWWMLPKLFFGPSSFNITHTLSINGLYEIPTPKSWNGALKTAVGGWQIGSILAFNSGIPTTPINNDDPLGLGNSGADQFGPLVKIPGCDPINHGFAGSKPGSPLWIKDSCYTEPSVPAALASNCTGGYPGAKTTAPYLPAGNVYCSNFVPGNVLRNSLYGPHLFNLDFAIVKNFPITKISEQFKVQFRAEMFNITNHDNFGPPQPCSGDCNSGLFNIDGSSAGVGTISQLATEPREIQFALKVNW